MKGKLVIFSAPSGAGKTTIVNYLLTRDLGLEFSVSACSREKRKGEQHGVDYYFLTVDEFKKKIENNEFVEWEEVYKDHFYGTLKSEIDRIWGDGKHVIFDLDVMGGVNMEKKYGEQALSVFVMPPSIESLEERLKLRKTETPESIARRMGKAEQELKMAKYFDKILHNHDLDQALNDAEEMVREFLAEK
jgi:guanylate kinase